MDLQTIGLLYLGCFLYWFSSMASEVKAHRKTLGFWNACAQYVVDNVFDIIISAAGCMVLSMFGSSIPRDLIDLSGPVSVLGAGYSAPSIINKLLAFKRA